MRLKVPLIPLNFWSIPRVRVSFHTATWSSVGHLDRWVSAGTARAVSSRKRRALKPWPTAMPSYRLGLAALERTCQGTWGELKLWQGGTGERSAAGSAHIGRLSTADWPDTAPRVHVGGVIWNVRASTRWFRRLDYRTHLNIYSLYSVLSVSVSIY
jgi:hypothetical protein